MPWRVSFPNDQDSGGSRDFCRYARPNFGEFARRKKSFDGRETKIGVGVDSVDSHRDWSVDIGETKGHALYIPLVGDEVRTVAQLYGRIHPSALETATVRTVFVNGPDKKVKLMLTYPAAISRNVDEILRVIGALQLGAARAVSTPVNWSSGGAGTRQQ